MSEVLAEFVRLSPVWVLHTLLNPVRGALGVDPVRQGPPFPPSSAPHGAREEEHLRDEHAYLEEQLRSQWQFNNVIGISVGFRDAMERVRLLAPSQETMLISGEAGTEKELVARLIHQLSPRQRRTFVKVDCGSTSAHLLAKKLFGYEKTDAHGTYVRHPGRLQLAHLSTLFLEEVSELPNEVQVRLVAALKHCASAETESGIGLDRWGSSLDIRLLASTSHDLLVLANRGQLNQELYELLTANTVRLLPLRERSEDIPLLVNHLVGRFARQMKKTIHTIPEQTMSALCAAPWHGNLRELELFIEREVMLTRGSTLHTSLLALEAVHDDRLEAAERTHILQVLRDARWVIGGPGGAAQRLGVKRTTLNSKLKKLGIQRDKSPACN